MIDVFTKLEDYLVKMASRTPEPTLEKLKKEDPLQGQSIQGLIQEFIENPDDTNKPMLNLVKEIMRQTMDENVKIEVIFHLCDVLIKRRKELLRIKEESTAEPINDENLTEFKNIIKDLKSQISKQYNDNELQKSYIEGLEKKRTNEIKALKIAEFEAQNQQKNRTAQEKQRQKFSETYNRNQTKSGSKMFNNQFKNCNKETSNVLRNRARPYEPIQKQTSQKSYELPKEDQNIENAPIVKYKKHEIEEFEIMTI